MSIGHESGPWVDFISFYFFQLPSLRIVHIDTADTVVDIDIGIDAHGEGIKSRTSTIPERLCTAELQPSPTMVIF